MTWFMPPIPSCTPSSQPSISPRRASLFLLPGCWPFRSGRYGWLAGSRARRLPRPGACRPGRPRQRTTPLLSSWARSTIPSSPRGSPTGVARHSRTRPLYRHFDLRGCRQRQDQRLHAPLRPATPNLGRRRSAPAGGCSGSGGQGRLLLFDPEDPASGRPGRRLSGDRPGRFLAMEPLGRSGLRQLLAGLHGLHLAQPAFRQIEGTLLAAGLHQPGPLDHRASPHHARRLGDAERHLPLRD